MLTLHIHGADFSDRDDRFAFAAYLGGLLKRAPFTPYLANEDDPSHWVIDSGNDWRVTFHDGHGKQGHITIQYRYNVPIRDDRELVLMHRLKEVTTVTKVS